MIAWVTHHLPNTGSGAAHHLPGEFAGGAEMTDQAWRDAAPEPITVIGPDDWQAALDADRVIITGTDLLTDEAMLALAERDPVLFVHHAQTRTPARRVLIDSASLFLVHTPVHLAHELQWTDPKRTGQVLSPLETDQIQPASKEPFAIWAQRWHPSKGPLAARMWAAENGVFLVMLSEAPRDEVLDTMAVAEHYVFLPLGLESESRATMEAVLSGCTVHANDRVGITSVPGWDDPAQLRDLLDGAAHKFWKLALS
jgi:hypothetical protein